jgi:hypothetical protein
MQNSLSNRTISSFPLSIGTALAFESLFSPRVKRYDEKREIPNNINPTLYNVCWINIATLLRNMIGSIEKQAFLENSERDFFQALCEEMDVIKSLFANEGLGVCTPRFFLNSYEGLKLKYKFKNIKFREDKTDWQRLVTSKENKVFKLFNRHPDVINGDYVLPKMPVKCLLVSHIPYDLTNYYRFSDLDLLESHTGKLKTKTTWGSKYHKFGEKDFSRLPFHEKLLMVFGDSVMIQPMDIAIRKLVLDISEKRNWTQLTTLDKINHDFQLEIMEPMVSRYLRDL